MQMLQEVYRLLVLTLGDPPVSFTWQYEDKDGELSPTLTFTPMEFYNELIGIDLGEYVMLMNDPSKEYYKQYNVWWQQSSDIPNRVLFPGNSTLYFSHSITAPLNRTLFNN